MFIDLWFILLTNATYCIYSYSVPKWALIEVHKTQQEHIYKTAENTSNYNKMNIKQDDS